MLPLSKAYKLLAPRPVWLVTTTDSKGRINAAPFSFVTPLEFDPPLLGFACDPEHDTYKNITETKEFVVNIPHATLAKQILICGKNFARGVNELEKAGLTWRKSEKVKPPLVNECLIAVECKLREIKEDKDNCFIIGEAVAIHYDKNVFDGELQLKRFKPLMHLGSKNFATAEEI